METTIQRFTIRGDETGVLHQISLKTEPAEPRYELIAEVYRVGDEIGVLHQSFHATEAEARAAEAASDWPDLRIWDREASRFLDSVGAWPYGRPNHYRDCYRRQK